LIHSTLQDKENENQYTSEVTEDLASIEEHVMSVFVRYIFVQEERHHFQDPGHSHDNEQFDVYNKSTGKYNSK